MSNNRMLERIANLTVVKRDGRKEPFDFEKLESSVEKALSSVERLSNELYESILQGIYKDLSLREGEVQASTISDLVEKHIINQIINDTRLEEAAKRYVLARIYNQVYGKKGWKEFEEDDLRLTFNALKVLEARYLLKDPDTLRFVETPRMMFYRVASHIASPGKKRGLYEYYRDRFFEVMRKLLFIPNSPTLMNAGTRNGVLSACYVIPVRDSMATPEGDGIMDAVRAMALIQQQGGGTGFDFSELRPEGDVVSSTAGVASGPVSFMKLFDVTTDVIKQGGKRRGANMGILHVWHPDIEKFVKSKTGELKDVVLQNFNISVGVYDEFMRAVEEDRGWVLINPRKTWLKNTPRLNSRYYAISRARHSINEQWVQEEILRELEENDWSIPLQDSRIITLEEAMTIAENEKAIVRKLKARELWTKIVEGAWDSGDPGIIFIDEMNRRHPVWYLGKINSTNPCVTGDTRVLTSEGLLKIEDLYETKRKTVSPEAIADDNAISQYGSKEAYPVRVLLPTRQKIRAGGSSQGLLHTYSLVSLRGLVWKVGLKPIVKITTEEGIEIKTTPDHKFLTNNGWKEAGKLRKGDEIVAAKIDIDKYPEYGKKKYNNVYLDPELGFLLGWITGRGKIIGNSKKKVLEIEFKFNEKNIAEYIEDQLRRFFGEDFAVSVVTRKGNLKMIVRKSKVIDTILSLGVVTDDQGRVAGVPESVFKAHSSFIKSFLRGLFSSEGHIDNEGKIHLILGKPEILKEIQQLLLLYGVKSYLQKPSATNTGSESPGNKGNKKENERASYRLSILGPSASRFMRKIGLFGTSIVRELPDVKDSDIEDEEFFFRISRVELMGRQVVYDMTVPIAHSYITQGMISHNCGEQPLLEWESCNLGSIDVSKFVIYSEGKPAFDWDGLAKVVRIAVRFLDNVIDMNKHPLEQINRANKFTRKIGLGIMGLAHLLAKLGLPYDSPEAVYFSYKLAEWIAYNASLESIRLAEEKGVFPAFKKEYYRPLWRTRVSIKEIESESGVALKKPDIPFPEINWDLVEREYEKKGIRNAALLSIAPTGTISIIAGASSSIEPIFALAFLRMVSVGSFIEIDRVFVKELEKRGLANQLLIRKIAENGSIQELDYIDDDLKRIYKTAHDIDPLWHVLHQAAWQAWVDAAVSKTINLRNEEPVETVDMVYKLAWKLHCKGITVYRDKSKSRQVLHKGLKTSEEKKEKKEEPKENEKRETRLVMKKLRIDKKEIVAVHEEYAGGCPTCDI